MTCRWNRPSQKFIIFLPYKIPNTLCHICTVSIPTERMSPWIVLTEGQFATFVGGFFLLCPHCLNQCAMILTVHFPFSLLIAWVWTCTYLNHVVMVSVSSYVYLSCCVLKKMPFLRIIQHLWLLPYFHLHFPIGPLALNGGMNMYMFRDECP